MLKNDQLDQWDRDTFFHPSTHLAEFARGNLPNRVVTGGEGCHIEDREGNRLLDAFAGLYCVNVGYGRPEIAEAIADQARELAYYHAYVGHGTEASITLAKMVLDRAPDHMSKVYFGLSGSDANETNVKLIWYYNNILGRPEKKKIISRWRGYHGSGLMTGSLTGLELFHKKFDLPLAQVIHTEAPYYYRRPDPEMSEAQFVTHCVAELEALIEREGADTIAAFIGEPVLGTGGIVPPPAGYWAAIQEVLAKHDILLVADEVVTGFGRLGTMFGSEHYGLKPDLITIAKGLTSAYAPLSGSILSDKMWKVLEQGTDENGPIGHGWTYSAHPIGAAAGGVDAFLIGTEMPGLTTIRSGASTYPAVQAYRDLLADVRSILGSGTKIGYAADWSEYFGHQPGDGSGDVFFHLDPLWADPEIDFVGIDNYMPLSDWRDGFEHADAAEGWPAIYDRAYLQANIAGGEGFDWFYASAADRSAQVRTPITDGAAGKPWVFRYKDLRAWWSNAHYDRPGGVESGTPTAWVPESKAIWFTELGCPAIDRGTNQPNVFFDPKSSESFTPHFSRGWRDDAIQRAYLEATYLWWGTPANNPVSSVYGGRMVHVPECAAWTWDARPYPFFPALTDVWTDGANWRLGHWLTGRLGAVSLAALVRHLCLRAGLPGPRIDVSGLWGAVEGYAITALESPRASITTLSRHFGFDAVETEGVIRFVMRGRASVATLAPDDLVAAREGDVQELTRGQETELPQALKWQVARADEDYDAALVEARRITVDTTRIASESFPMAVPPEEAERRCRRALMEAWVGRETAAFRLPPSRLALDPADAIRLQHDGRLVDLRLVSIADAEARGIEAVRQDRATYDLPPGDPRAASLTRAVVFGAPDAVLMDLPQLTEEQPAHRPLVAAHAVPWPGEMAVFRSPSTDGFELLTTFGSRARIGALVSDFFAGPTSRFDLGNALVVDLLTGTLESVTDLTLFGGSNALAIESAPGVWEIVQAGTAELLAPGRYRLTRLLRGQRGTEGAMGTPTPAGARVVVLDDSLATLPIAEADLAIPWNWRIGPASRPVTDETYVAQAFTPVGVGLRPFSVGHVEQPWRTPRAPGDLTIRWTRRSRALAADSWGGLEVPLAEELEAYEVEILDGASVKRVLSTATTSAVYTAAHQIADWGAPLGPGDTLDIRISQLSALVGRGAPKLVTLTF